MTPAAQRTLRTFLASIILVSGLLQVAVLWLAPLTVQTMLAALAGGVYLLLALGLFGQSRLSLFLGCVVPALRIGLPFLALDQGQWEQLRTAIDLILVIGCGFLLWQARHQLSR